VCGICGLVNLDVARPADQPLLAAMTDSLAHRGPDGEGVRADGPAGLGHRRLAIIDTSAAAAQPLGNEDGSVWLVCNGEVYNHLELRERLEARGHRFRSRSDSEVVLHLYEEEGDACVRRLRGMYAFAVWDGPRRRLLLGRDRFGQKPLYFGFGDGRVVFASEIRTLLLARDLERSISAAAIDRFLALGYVPGPETVFDGVRSLEPGSVAVIEDGTLTVSRYWQLPLPPEPAGAGAGSVADAEAELLARLRESVRLQLMSDRPLGAFLSGGLDSAVVVALMAEVSRAPVLTFSIGFSEPESDESPYARRVAAAVGSEHAEHTFSAAGVRRLPELVCALGQPFGDPSILPTDLLCRMTSARVKVALNGDGGDEGFFGYDRYVKHRVALAWGRVPRRLRQAAARAAGLVPRRPPWSGLPGRVADFLAFDPADEAELYCRWVLSWGRTDRQRLYAPAFAETVAGVGPEELVSRALGKAGGRGAVERALRADVATYLADDLLVKMDMASMAHGLEARSPFLDHELFEFVASLPVGLRLRGLSRKWLLKRVAAPHVPRETVRRAKRGFGIPVARWLRGELRDMLRETLLSRRAVERGMFVPSAVSELIDAHLTGREDHQYRLWNLLVLELWFSGVVDAAA